MTAIKTMLRAALFTGAIAFLPSLAAAGESQPSPEPTTVPDHAQAEARGVPIDAPTQTPAIVPDHAQAEARSTTDTPPAIEMEPKGVPDHAAAENADHSW